MKQMPNILTVLRLLACPLLIYLFKPNMNAEEGYWVLIIFVLACLTDFFDGYLARKGNYKSNFGKFLDPIADKALILTMCFLIVFRANISIVAIPFLIIAIREIIVSFLRFNLSRWNRNKNIDVSLLSKYKTFIQMLAIGGVLSFEFIPFPIILSFWGITYYSYVNSNIFMIYGHFVIFLIILALIITLITGVQHYKTYLELKQFEGKK